MKKLFSAVSAALLLFSFAPRVSAGTLTLDGQPTFQPSVSFTSNSITAVPLHNPQGFVGDVVRLLGDSKLAPSAAPPTVFVGGHFSANAGDLFSVVYAFTINLASTTPINLTIGAQTTVDGVDQTFDTVVAITPGIGQYQGQLNGPAFGLARSGTWSGHLVFNFTPADGVSNPDPGGILLKVRAVDFRLASVPEPSTCVLLVLGLAALGTLATRRRRIV